MEWTQQKTIQFIEYYKSYPFLWDSKHELYKNKILRHNALIEIAANFEVEKVEIERKIKNLQSHFLREKKKEQDSKKSGSGNEESFTSKWFAYKSLLFLPCRNKARKAVDSKMELLIVDDSEQSEPDHGTEPHFTKFQESTDEQPLESPLSLDIHTERPLSREATSRKRTESNADPLSDSSPVSKKERQVQFSTTKKQTEERFSHNTDRTNCSDKEEMVNVIAECNLYGQLLAQKIKPLDAEDRLVLMNEIDNLVFKHLMNIRKRNKLSRTGHLLSTDQTYSDTRQSIDLPGPSYKSNETQEGSQKNMQYSEYEIPMPFRILKTETEASHQ